MAKAEAMFAELSAEPIIVGVMDCPEFPRDSRFANWCRVYPDDWAEVAEFYSGEFLPDGSRELISAAPQHRPA
ncbi:MAG: hypothetical protein ACLP4W_09905 [Mycobacterium sp.]|uniref:hypothetical protein n=1 Tax=Mycobacterium sp. TaxID=1785 RepID=UPI003F99E46D